MGASAGIGTRTRKHNGRGYLTGKVTYTADVTLPRMVHAAVARSPHPHARIRAMDVEAARARPGVLAVLTGAEAVELAHPIPFNLDPAGLGGKSAPVRCLALEKAVYAGEPVAAVVALTAGDARAAVEELEVDYEPLPHVLGAEEALAEGAPLLYPDWGSNLMISGSFGDGDFEEAAAAADHVLEAEITLGRTSAAPIEPRAYVADWDEMRERLTWYGTTQNPHPQRWVLATALGLGEHQVHVIAPPAGGAFGLKMHGHPEEVLVAVLTRLVGRPVKWVESREECLLPGGKQQTQRVRVAYGADGRVEAVHSRLVADHGAMSAGPGWGMVFVAGMTLPTGYAIENCTVEYAIAVTNKPPWSGSKPFGKDAPVLVMERVMDLVAEATGLVPEEVRRRNWIAPDAFPHPASSGLVLDSGNYAGLLDALLACVDLPALRAEQEQLRRAGRYLGVGLGFEMLPEGADIPGALVSAYDSATVRMDASGHVTVLTGVTSPGGGNDTAIAQIVAERLGTRLEDISIVQGDTDRCPYGYGNLSSRGLTLGGTAAASAADDLAHKLRIISASMLEVEADSIRVQDGFATAVDDPEKAVPLAAVAHAAYSLAYVLAPGIDPMLESTRTFKLPNVRHLPDDKGRVSPYTTFSSSLHASVVEVDAETGGVEVREHAVVHDCGTMVNPLFVEGQVQGGVVMGIGAALGEELLHGDDGRLVSDGFKTYLLRRADDLPGLRIEHQVTPSPFTPLGTKGAGEAGYACALASIVNAVNDALRPLGARIERVPMTPPRVLAAIRAGQGETSR